MATKKSDQDASAPAIVLLVLIFIGFIAWKSPLFQRNNPSNSHPVKAGSQELAGGNSKEINSDSTGERIDVMKHTVSGHTTLFDFYSQYCGPCMALAPVLVQLTKVRPDFAVRSIDVNRPGVQGIDWESPVCQQYEIHSLPYFILVGPDGKIVAQGQDASLQVREIMSKELTR